MGYLRQSTQGRGQAYLAWAGLLTVLQGTLSWCWEVAWPRVSTAKSSRIWWLMALCRVGRKGECCETTGSLPQPAPTTLILSVPVLSEPQVTAGAAVKVL